MKLATYKDGSRDGQLIVVSRDLSTAHYASGIANRLQQVLDDWNFMSPQLQELYENVCRGKARHAFPFDPKQCMAPLPRAYQWVVASAYPSHAQLLEQARGGEVSAALASPSFLRQGCSDAFLGPVEDVVCASESYGIDFEAHVAAITADVRIGADAEQGIDAVRLLLLANDVSLRQLASDELQKWGGWFHSKPATAFSPVAVTPDELGPAWDCGRVHLPLQSSWNGRRVGLCDAAAGMRFHFGQLITHASKTRHLRAGTLIGSGPVSHPGEEVSGRMQWAKGFHCLAEKRAMETLQDGQPSTDYLKYGDTVRIDMKGHDGQSIFGAIEQEVVAP